MIGIFLYILFTASVDLSEVIRVFCFLTLTLQYWQCIFSKLCSYFSQHIDKAFSQNYVHISDFSTHFMTCLKFSQKCYKKSSKLGSFSKTVLQTHEIGQFNKRRLVLQKLWSLTTCIAECFKLVSTSGGPEPSLLKLFNIKCHLVIILAIETF